MKRITALLLLLALLCGCSAATPVPQEDESLIVVGFSQVGAESDWRVANSESIKNTFTEANGYELMFSDARQQQENQFTAIRNFIQQEVQYIILAPVQESGWESVLEEARDAGIPVILLDRKIDVADESLYTSWVGTDFKKEAVTAMDWLSSTLEASGRAEDTIRILHLQGTMGCTAQLMRTKGLEETAAAHPNWVIAGQLHGEFTQAKAYEVTSEYLRSRRDLDVVYCENDNMAFGVMQALDEAGLSYGVDGDVILISFDAARRALESCLDGKINLCMECNPLQGPRVAELIQALERGETVPRESYVPETFFTPDTLTPERIAERVY